MPIITTPTVGRKVWYTPSANDKCGPVPMIVTGPLDGRQHQPLDATIIAVWGDDRMVNVLVTDVYGRQFPVLSCDLLQDGDQPKTDADGVPIGRYVEWMPYQKAQAAKPDVHPALAAMTPIDATA